jgi:hypothetical protein
MEQRGRWKSVWVEAVEGGNGERENLGGGRTWLVEAWETVRVGMEVEEIQAGRDIEDKSARQRRSSSTRRQEVTVQFPKKKSKSYYTFAVKSPY